MSIPSMEPPISTTDSVPIPFDESDPEKMLMLELIKERYLAIEHPFLTSSRDGFTWLIIPRTLTRKFDADKITTETPATLRVPDGTGGSDGISN